MEQSGKVIAANDGTGDVLAIFGYYNRNAVEVILPDSVVNKLSPANPESRDIEKFLAGRQVDVRSVRFNGGNMVWVLDRKTATAASSNIIEIPAGLSRPEPVTSFSINGEETELSWQAAGVAGSEEKWFRLERKEQDVFREIAFLKADQAQWSVNDVVDGDQFRIYAVNKAGISDVKELTISSSGEIDTDRDQMPDDWETANGLDPNNAADAVLDPDDG